jgi:hypothetical protein
MADLAIQASPDRNPINTNHLLHPGPNFDIFAKVRRKRDDYRKFQWNYLG